MATQLEIAEKLGISDRWLRKLIEDGVIENAGRGQFDLAIVARQYISHQGAENARLKAEAASLRAAVDRVTETPDGEAKGKSDARRSSALAEKAEIEVAEMRGLLVPAEEIADALNAAVGVMVSQMRSLPSKVAARIGARDPAVAEKILRGEVNEALSQLSRVAVRGGAAAN